MTTWRPERLVLVGSVIADVAMAVPRLPDRGGDVLASTATVRPGGGFNVLAAARRLGLPAALGGRIGGGPYGRAVSEALAAEGVAPLLLPEATGDTGFCVVLVEPDAERTFVTSPGVESELSSADLAALGVRPTDAVYVSGYDLCYPVTGPALAAWCANAAPAALVVLDPGPLAADIPPAVLEPVLDRVDVLTLNAREAGLMSGADGEAAARTLRARLRPEAALIVRLGARGCALYPPDGGPVERIAAPPVSAVDTTGAGDAHTGALLAELHRTGSLAAAARSATAAAALAVTRPGPATGPTRTELAGHFPDER